LLAQSFDLTDEEFQMFKELIQHETGIFMSTQKKKLVVARLSKRLRALNLNTFTDYYKYIVENPARSSEIDNLINRITTNKTDFFREMHHFEFLRDEAFPVIIQEGERTGKHSLRIWSAGCSSGEEPYSIAITTAEAFKNKWGWDIKILATDLDTEVLRRAAQGTYPTQVIAPVPREYLAKHFTRTGSEYTVSNTIKSLVVFRRLNFMDPAFPMKKPFDIIFCRNVIIYFDQPTKVALMSKFHYHLKDDGYMFIGHSESLMGMKDKFSYIKNTVYRKV
jgi:chemotaxis protein methyltransferase CheR